MAIKEIPINYRVYYNSMRNTYTQLKEDAVSAHKDLVEVVTELHKSIDESLSLFEKEFGVNLLDYQEYAQNRYIDGSFFKVARGLFLNRKNNYALVSDLFDLYSLATKQKEINSLEKDIALYDKILSLGVIKYNSILKAFYTEVHRQMITKGYGYVFEQQIGWTCINRCHIHKQSPHIDYAATKKRKAELQAEGKRLWNKEERDWCLANGYEYDGVDFRVYMNNEYCYEIPLIGCKLPNGFKYKLEISDYRGRDVRGLSNEDLKNKANGNLDTVCNYSLDIRTKLNICNAIDKTLYTNFIRNENQEPLNIAKIGRKNR